MCFKPKAQTQTVNQTVPQPDATAEPTAIGKPRAAEDTTLFGGTPDLRVDRSTTPAAVSTGGTGLNLM